MNVPLLDHLGPHHVAVDLAHHFRPDQLADDLAYRLGPHHIAVDFDPCASHNVTDRVACDTVLH